MTWAQLRALWDERDDRYRRRRFHGAPIQFNQEETAAVRDYRQSEIAMLPLDDRGLAVIALGQWMPPRAMS